MTAARKLALICLAAAVAWATTFGLIWWAAT